jgi:DNA adenine methylase
VRYMGGKGRVAKQIAQAILRESVSRQTYVEPFVGGASVAAALAPSFAEALLSDAHPDLMALWEAVLFKEWEPPASLSEEDYFAVRESEGPSPARAFAGFGCSFGGKFFRGYARSRQRRRNGERPFAQQAGSALRGKRDSLLGCPRLEVTCGDYRGLTIPPGSVVYCDPPYCGTEVYPGTGRFNSPEFWSWAGEQSESNEIFVSEYLAPPDWRLVWEKDRECGLSGGVHRKRAERRVERLWTRDASGGGSRACS